MALTLLQSTNPITYELCQVGDGTIYNPSFCVAPRTYREEFFSSGAILGFYYDENVDEYVVLARMQFAAWPSWRINAYHISPVTGLVTSEELGVNPVGNAWARAYENGQFGKVYANRFAGSGSNSITPVDTETYELDLDFPVVESADVGGTGINKFLLNRTDFIVALAQTSRIERWNYSTATQLESITMPEWTAEDMAYESESLGWVLASSSVNTEGLAAVKINYLNPAVEMLSKIESNGTEVQSGIAYDSKRKVIAVFRNMPVDTDGGSLDILDFYKPIIVPTNITAPVPMSKLTPGATVIMKANLIGDRGEAGTIKPITITNTGDGTILQPTVTAKTNGSISFQYLVGANPGSDTITLQVST